MSIFDNILKRKPREIDMLRAELEALKAKSSDWPSFALATAQARQHDIPNPITYDAQAMYYQRLSWVYQAVNIVCSFSATTPFGVKRLRGERETEIDNHPFEQLLRNPNPLQSRFEFLYNSFAFYKLNGNCFWWQNKTNEDAIPAELWLLPPSSIRVVPDGQMYIRGYLYDPGNGQELPLDPWEIVHFRAFHPLNWWMGMGGMEPAALASQNDLAMQEWNRKLFTDGNGKLPGILAFADPIPDSDWQKMKDDVRDKANKRDLMMLRNVKQGGVQWMRAAETQKEMEFIAGRDKNKEEIYATLAPGLLAALSPSANVSNSDTGYVMLRDMAIYPLLAAFQEKITADILIAYNTPQITVIGEFDDVRTKDRVFELSQIAEYSKTHTVNEVREKFWNDAPLNKDDRGELFPAQVTSGNGPIEEETPEEIQPQTMPDEMQPTDDTPDENQDLGLMAQPDEDEEDMALKAELDRWKRKAKNAIERGKSPAVKFDSDIIPADMAINITTGLQAAKTSQDIADVFALPTKSKPVPTAKDVTDMLRELIKYAHSSNG